MWSPEPSFIADLADKLAPGEKPEAACEKKQAVVVAIVERTVDKTRGSVK